MPPESKPKLTTLWRRRIQTWVIAALALYAGFYFFFSDGGVWGTMVKRNDINQKAAEVDSLARMNRLMHGRIEALKRGDKQAIEEEARAHGMIKEGEKIYIFKERETLEDKK